MRSTTAVSMRWAALAAILAAAVACNRDTGTQGRAAAPAPTPDPPRGVIRGVVTLEGETDHSGVLVFLAGTGHIAYTDENGAYEIAGAPPGKWRVLAQRTGFQQRRLDEITVDAARPGPQVFELLAARLARSAIVSEIVEKALGSIAGFVRYADRDDHSGIGVRISRSIYGALTEGDGAFALHNIEPGSYTLEIVARGYQSQKVAVVVEAGQTTFVPDAKDGPALILQPDAPAGAPAVRRVRGSVALFDRDGAPVPRFDETLVALEGTGYVAAPNPEGRFLIDNIAPGRYAVVAMAPGYLLAEKIAVDLEATAEASVDLRLDQAPPESPLVGAVRGRIVLEGGAAPTGAQAGLAGTSFIAVADGAGAFQIDNVTPGAYTLVAAFTDHEKEEIENVLVAADQVNDVGDIELLRAVRRPTVLVTTPYDGQGDVTVEPVVGVAIRFSEKMDPSRTIAAVSISPAVEYVAHLGRQHPLSDYDLLYLELSGVGQRAVQFETTYQVAIAGSATDVNNVEMETPYTFSFVTARPEIMGTWPEDGAGEVVLSPVERPVEIYFNARIDPGSLNDRTVRVTPSGGYRPTIYVQTDPQTGWSTAYIRMAWQRATRYTITLDGRVALEDGRSRLGNLPYRFAFTTARGVEIGERLPR